MVIADKRTRELADELLEIDNWVGAVAFVQRVQTAERERCALVCEKAFFAYRRGAGMAATGPAPKDAAMWQARADAAGEMARQIRHPTAPPQEEGVRDDV